MPCREARRREQLEKDIMDTRAQIEARTMEVKLRQNELQSAEQRIGRLEQTIKEQEARPPLNWTCVQHHLHGFARASAGCWCR